MTGRGRCPPVSVVLRTLAGGAAHITEANEGLWNVWTAALVLLVAACMAVSGVPVPPSGTTDNAVWLEYCKTAVATDRLVAHFEGFPTAFATMVVIAALSVLAYPLYMMARGNTATPTAASSSGQDMSACPPRGLTIQAVAVGAPSAAVWGVAVWGMRQYTWGLASGLWVGLFCACVTLKMTSFVAAAIACSASTPTTKDTPPEGAEKIYGDSAVTTASAAAVAEWEWARETAATTSTLLTFGEFLFFMFLSPALVCEMHLMKVSARRPSRPLRATFEFLHALLAFLAVHCVAGSMLAPSLRLFVTAVRPAWVEGSGAAWAELDAVGGGGWPSWTTASHLMKGDNGGWVTVATFLWQFTLVSSCEHFLVFYAFWHCVCLGMAELWGFPDRHLYGCWWLIFDDPRYFLRSWSVPVHRWLSACVHWPMLEAAGAGAPFRTEAKQGRNGDAARDDEKEDTDVGKDTDKPPPPLPSSKKGWLLAVLATFVVSAVFHEAVVYVAMRGSIWPFNTFLLTVAATLVVAWDSIFPPPKHGKRPILSDLSSDGCGDSRGGGGVVATAEEKSAEGSLVRTHRGRGIVAALAFTVLIQLSAFICDIAAWLWWRNDLMT